MANTENSDQVLSAYLESISRYPLLEHDEEISLSKRVANGDKAAREKLINSNLRLVVKMAKGYATPEMAMMDVIQEGNLGLITAAGKYDHSRRVRFSTYASCWIKQAMIRAIANKRRPIRLPHRKEEAIRRLRKLKDDFWQNFSRPPSFSELASYARISESELNVIMRFQIQMVSLDSGMNDNSCTLLDTLKDESFSPHDSFEKENMKLETIQFLSSLREREQKILRYRFALDGEDRQTLKSIGEKMGISPETVRQIELKALRKLRTKAEMCV